MPNRSGERVKYMRSKSIKVDFLARVEGEGGLTVNLKGDQVTNVQFRIYEPPRFFEAFLRGRRFTEAPDITARICGICPIAYQISSTQAMENICGVSLNGQLQALRRMIYCGEWIESHVLHIYMLHAPDFLGYEDAISLAKDAPDAVKRGLRLKEIGNRLVILLGGREIHPINIRVGGFYKVPTHDELMALVPDLEWAVEAAEETVRWTAGFNFPDLERDYEFVSLRHENLYPLEEGRIVSSRGIDIGVHEFLDYFEEEHVPHSTSLHARVKKRGEYATGPMARYNNNFDRLPDDIQKLAREVGLGEKCHNPFKSIIVRSIETLYACREALRLINEYKEPARPFTEVPARRGTGHGCSEAPRGSLYHRYTIDDDGIIQDARIIPPTSQNQKVVESDLLEFVQNHINLPKDELTWKCEQIVRNYDPCISCSCHFLKLKILKE